MTDNSAIRIPSSSLIAADVLGPASSTDHAVVRFDGPSGKLLQNSTVLLTDAGQFLMDSASTARALITIGTNASISSDPKIAITSTVASGTGYYTGFTDSARVTAASTLVTSFDSRTVYSGSNTFTTHNSFNSHPNLTSSSTFTSVTGFQSNLTVNGPTLTNSYGVRISNPTITSGSLTNNYGLYIDDLTAGTNKYSVYSNSTAYSYIRSNVGVGRVPTTHMLEVAGNVWVTPTVSGLVSSNTYYMIASSSATKLQIGSAGGWTDGLVAITPASANALRIMDDGNASFAGNYSLTTIPARLDIVGSTTDGTTKILTGRNSSGTNVFTLDTFGRINSGGFANDIGKVSIELTPLAASSPDGELRVGYSTYPDACCLSIGHSQRLSYFYPFIGRNISGKVGTDSYRALWTGPYGYEGIEFKYATGLVFYSESGATVKDASISPTYRMIVGPSGITVSSLTGSRLVATTSGSVLESVSNLATWIAGTSNQVSVTSDGAGKVTLSTPQSIGTGSSPTFAGLTIGTLTGVLRADTGVVSVQAVGSLTGSNITVTGTGSVVGSGGLAVSIPQSVALAATPTFAKMYLTNTSSQIVLGDPLGITGTLGWTPTTTNRSIIFPDKSGTVALTSDLVGGSPHDAVTMYSVPNNGLSIDPLGGQVLRMGLASTSTTGALSSTDWNTFNGKTSYVDPLDTRGQILYRSASATAALNKGTTGQVLMSSATDVYWATLSATHDPVTIFSTANGLSFDPGGSQVLKLVAASTSTTGALTSTDWNTFNGKQAALTIGNITCTNISVTGGTGAIIGSGVALSIPQSVATSATPLFASMTLNALTNQLVFGATTTGTLNWSVSSTSKTINFPNASGTVALTTTAPAAHALVDTVNHTASGLTTGHFLKATGATTYAFGVHGLTYTDVGAAASGHTHTGVYEVPLTFSRSLARSINDVTLDNDVESPGNGYSYSTNASGTKGWYPNVVVWAENADADTGSNVADSFTAPLTIGACTWNYLLLNHAAPTNVRSGIIMATWLVGSGSPVYEETCTTDIGDTSPVTFTVTRVGSSIRLNAVATTDNWAIRVNRSPLLAY